MLKLRVTHYHQSALSIHQLMILDLFKATLIQYTTTYVYSPLPNFESHCQHYRIDFSLN